MPPEIQDCDYRMALSVVPASTSKQEINPCMLHVSIMDPKLKQKVALFGTELKQANDWQVVIDVEHGNAYYIPNYGDKDRFEIDCVKDGRIMLGPGNLQVTIFCSRVYIRYILFL